MHIQMNLGSNELLDEGVEHDTEFGFSVTFDNGERCEVTFEPDIVDAFYVHTVRCKMFAPEDGPVQSSAMLVGGG